MPGAGAMRVPSGAGLVDRIGPACVLPRALSLVALAYATMPLTVTALAGAFAAASVWGSVNHFVLNVVVLRLSEVGGQACGAVPGLNTAITYGSALVGSLTLGVAYASEERAWLALPAGCCVGLAAGLILVRH